MASIDVAKLLNKITQDIPGINTVLKALAKWDVSALTDVPDGAMQATTDTNNRLTIKKKVSDSYTPVTKLMHDVDTVDGYHASTAATANTVAVRNASGALPGNILGNAATANTATALAAGAVVPVDKGGTGATSASQARANLGVANGADFTAHIAKQASPSVEGHVKLDALAADGSNTAAPGGFGLGMPEAKQIPANTDLDSIVLPGFYSCKMGSVAGQLLNCPTGTAFSMLVEYGAYGPTQTLHTYNNNGRYRRTKQTASSFSSWKPVPVGISDSTSTVSSTIAASASAVKAVNDAASGAQTDASTALARTAPATTTSRGIGRVATAADMAPGATVENGPALLAAGSPALSAIMPTFLIGSVIAHSAADSYVPNGCVPANGGEYTRAQFPSLYDDYLVGGKLITCTYAEQATQVGLTGNCGRFALDTVNQKFKVPLVKNGDSITQAASAAEIGKSYKAGLPNITGTFGNSKENGTPLFQDTDTLCAGAFTGTDGTYARLATWNAYTGKYTKNVNFDASKSSSVYGNSTTVTAEQIRLRHFVVMASAQNNASMFDWSNYMAALAGKANNDLSNLDSAARGEIRSRVIKTLRATRRTTGIWTITGLTPNEEVLITASEITNPNCAITPTDGWQTCANVYCSIGTTAGYGQTASMALLPSNSTVTINVITLAPGATLKIWQ